jgi:hypothetical protein
MINKYIEKNNYLNIDYYEWNFSFRNSHSINKFNKYIILTLGILLDFNKE